jgi:hypothetical protein
MSNRGRVQAVNVISPTRRWWALWLVTSWKLADRMPLLKRTLRRLAFIHVAHWSVVWRVSGGAGGNRSRRLPHPYLIFHSNYNDDLVAYLDAFALIVPWRMRLMWHGVYRFPGPGVVDRFVSFVRGHVTRTAHYYCAYPEGSARMIAAALELSDRHWRFREEASTLTDEQFAVAWERFVADNELLM